MLGMRLTVSLFVFMLLAGCRSTSPYVVPDVAPDATALVLHDDVLPRTLYASAWGAFAVAEWEVVASEPQTFRLQVRPPDADAVLDLEVSAEMEHGRAVASTAVARTEAHAVLEAAAAVLATVPGHLTVR